MKCKERVQVSWFSGIAIEMCLVEDGCGAPHFHAHAEYEERSAVFSLEGSLLDGSLPSWGIEDVKEWTSRHADELREAWHKCQQGEIPSPIRSLDDDDEWVQTGERLPELIEVEARDGFRIWVRFDDEVSGEVDLSHLEGLGVFKAWDDRGFFESVYLSENGVPAWGEGEDVIDIDALKLHMDLTGKTAEEMFPEFFETPANA